MADRLTDAQITEGVAKLPGWTRATSADGSDTIVHDFQFVDFVAALGFIAQVGALAERANHHPELTNVYNRVHIALSTHDAGGVTDLDLKLAEAISARAPWNAGKA
jgi:4a-hydroxytetrahydrobiopterin dehydratase